ncbi:MAG TPA: ECF-type sigma factor [Gemmataceae bacterium]|nr:ECF-type sigma factor [Gemmataceae bacterium]
MSNEEFADLLARARQDEQQALAALHQALEEKLRRAAHRRLGRVLRRYLDSADIVQSTQKSLLICLCRKKYDIPNEEKLTALALRILQRKVAQKWRKVRRELNLYDRLAQDPNSRIAAADGAAPTVENAELVHHLMKYMNETEKALVQLLLQGHTITSAARLLELTPAYARVLLSRMRARLGTMFDLPRGFP